MSSPQFPEGTKITAALTESVRGCHSIFVGQEEFYPILLEDRIVWSLIPGQQNDFYVGEGVCGRTTGAW